MADTIDAIPAEYGPLSPYVAVRGAAGFITFLERAFDAVERGRVPNEDGTIGHAEVLVGGRVLLMFDARPQWPDTPALLCVYVPDCDATHRAALEAGAAEVTPLSTSAWGDRGSRIRDPFGNVWWIQTRVEAVPPEEAVRRMGEPRYLADMKVAVDTLDAEMRRRVRPSAAP